MEESGHGVAALLICPFFANEGFPTLEYGFLDEAVGQVRKAGGIVIADEVQPGFGRLGTNWWGYQKIGLAPEIVTMGKPMANGHPVASVVTSAEIIKRIPDFPGLMDKAEYALKLMAEGKLNLGINNKSLEMEQMKLKNFKNNIIISLFGIVIVFLLVF